MLNHLLQPFRCGPEEPAGPTAGGAAAPTAAASDAGAEVLDAGALERLRELDPSGANRLLERVLAAFESSVTRLLPQMQVAQQNGDAAGVRHVAHTLKSSSASIGAIKLSSLCAEIETMIRLGQLEGMQARVDAVDHEIGRVLRALTPLLGAKP